jgi:hypothetical protein
MTVAYCIAAHTKPSQCRRLIQRLLDDDPSCLVLVHFDQRNAKFDLTEVADPRARIIGERAVNWGSPELVDLFVEMLRVALSAGCSYAVMLSGQDYPLREVSDLEADLSSYDVWATTKPLFAADGSCTWKEGRRRYSYQWWHADEPGWLLRLADGVAGKVPGAHVSEESGPPLPYLVHFRQYDQLWWGVRSKGPGVPVHAGSQWMNLSSRAMEAICSAPQRVMRFFHQVPVADEACFHTILSNTKGLTFAPDNARFIRWGPLKANNPDVLTTDDLDALISSGAMFARKFDEMVDSAVLDRLDLLSNSSK